MFGPDSAIPKHWTHSHQDRDDAVKKLRTLKSFIDTSVNSLAKSLEIRAL